MALRVFGSVKQQTEHGRRHALSPNQTRLRQRILRRRLQLRQGALDLSLQGLEQFADSRPLAWRALFRQRISLFIRQRLAARVREQTIDDARDMLEVEPDRGHIGWTIPQAIIRKASQDLTALLSYLQERVSDRLQ